MAALTNLAPLQPAPIRKIDTTEVARQAGRSMDRLARPRGGGENQAAAGHGSRFRHSASYGTGVVVSLLTVHLPVT